MKIKVLSFLLIASGLAVGASAQVTTPTPAPVVTSAYTPNQAVQANRVIYSPRLPTPTELSNVAAAQGQSIDRIDQTDSQISVTYRSANGQVTTISYQLLPNSGDQVATTTTVVTRPAPTVVYTRPAPYYYSDPYLYPWGYGYYSPVSVSLGFGYGWGHGYYRGGYGYRHGGGWRHR